MPGEGDTVVIMLSPPGQEQSLPQGAVVTAIDGVDARQYLDARAEEAWRSGGYPSPQRASLFACVRQAHAKGEIVNGRYKLVIHWDIQASGIVASSGISSPNR